MSRLKYGETAQIVRDLPADVRARRNGLGQSLREAADQIGCAHSVLWRFEQERGNLSLTTLVAVLHWLAEPAGDEPPADEPS